MISRPTVLILGAGASQPYGFPLGAGLVDQVSTEILEDAANKGLIKSLEDLEGQPRFIDRLQQLGLKRDRVVRFAKDLQRARPYSIDAFLEARKGFRNVGKAAIADVLLRAEAASTIATAAESVDWYRYIFNRFLVLKSPDHFKHQAHRLTIITFNFDRSFERALFESLRATFGLTGRAARQLAAELPIHHIHGLLGLPDFLVEDGDPDTTAYGPHQKQLQDAALIAAGQIRIVDEEIDKAVTADAQAAIAKATFVYFVGFGFDERNLRKLGIPEILFGKSNVHGTAFNLTEFERRPIEQCFEGAHIMLHAADALTFIRRHAEAFFER